MRVTAKTASSAPPEPSPSPPGLHSPKDRRRQWKKAKKNKLRVPSVGPTLSSTQDPVPSHSGEFARRLEPAWARRSAPSADTPGGRRRWGDATKKRRDQVASRPSQAHLRFLHPERPRACCQSASQPAITSACRGRRALLSRRRQSQRAHRLHPVEGPPTYNTTIVLLVGNAEGSKRGRQNPHLERSCIPGQSSF